ncbi:hypothetical protein NL676_005278 [Syzygium grande]|nr:hypothetical protein NL676_005278 [Syzygium grande]
MSSEMKNMKPPLLLFFVVSVSLERSRSRSPQQRRRYLPTDDIKWTAASSPAAATPWQTVQIPLSAGSHYTASASPGSEFAHTFHVTVPKSVRLHFFPSDYSSTSAALILFLGRGRCFHSEGLLH